MPFIIYCQSLVEGLQFVVIRRKIVSAVLAECQSTVTNLAISQTTFEVFILLAWIWQWQVNYLELCLPLYNPLIPSYSPSATDPRFAPYPSHSTFFHRFSLSLPLNILALTMPPWLNDRGYMYIVFVTLVCLSVCPSVCLHVYLSVVNFNIRYNFWNVRGRDFIPVFDVHTQLMMPFQLTPRSLTFTLMLE